MAFRILGPLAVTGRDGRDIRLPAGRARTLLALLLVQRGQVVSSDRIIDTLWGGRPPDTAGKAVQGYVSQLRRLLEPAMLVTRGAGYALVDAELDAEQFERLAAAGRRALEDGASGETLRLLEQGLALWRGPPLSDFAFDDFAQDEIRRLEELRAAAVEDRAEAMLQLGRHRELAGHLGSLVAAHPLRERLRGEWMLALYRSGRQADALEAYRDGRRLLASELGLDPGPELQRLERSMLAQDPALDFEEVAPVRSAPSAPVSTPPRRRRRATLALAAALAVVTAVVAGVLLLRDDASPPPPVAIVPPVLAVVDPQTNSIVAGIDVGSKPVSVAAGEGAVWVGDARDGTVTRIDPARRRAVRTIGIGAPAIDLAAGAGSVWAATGGFGVIARIDPRLGAVSGQIDLHPAGDPVVPRIASVGVAGGRLWVGAFNGLVRIDPRSGAITGRVRLGHSPGLQLALDRGSVWATLFDQRARRVDAGSVRPTAQFYAGTLAVAIARDRSALWLAGADDGALWKLDPDTGATLLTSRAGTGASALALGSGSLWVASFRDNTLVRLDERTGQPQATIPLPGSPQDLAVADGLVWVALQAPE